MAEATVRDTSAAAVNSATIQRMERAPRGSRRSMAASTTTQAIASRSRTPLNDRPTYNAAHTPRHFESNNRFRRSQSRFPNEISSVMDGIPSSLLGVMSCINEMEMQNEPAGPQSSHELTNPQSTQMEAQNESINLQSSQPNEDTGEAEAAEKVLNAMLYYRRYVFMRLKRQADAVKLMRADDRALIYPAFPRHVKLVRKLADENQKLFDMIANFGAKTLDPSFAISDAFEMMRTRPTSEHYMSKVRTTLKQIVRDWTTHGAEEREASCGTVLAALEQCYPNVDERHNIHCLVAGAGLARLAWELIQRGFSVTGNEFSLFMILTSNFILNACETEGEFTVFPYILDSSNSWAYGDQLMGFTFPDVVPSINSGDRKNTFAMCAGDFLQAFKQENEFDSVITVFFVDTATNPINYIRHIHRILKPGGVWLNFGPLTYHFDYAEDCVSLDLPFDELVRMMPRVGFRVDAVRGRDETPPAQYAANPHSMLQYSYHCGFFQCTKLES